MPLRNLERRHVPRGPAGQAQRDSLHQEARTAVHGDRRSQGQVRSLRRLHAAARVHIHHRQPYQVLL